MNEIELAKRCGRCREVKPLTEFHLRTRSSDGRQPRCKACALELRAAWRRAHGQEESVKAAARERTRQWRDENPDRWRASNRAWQAANPEKQRDGVRRFHLRNPEYNAIKSREYAAAHPERARAYRRENAAAALERCAARRAQQLRAMPPWADRAAIAALYREARQLMKETGVEWHVDHIIPLQHPRVCGLHIPANLQLLPGIENMRKGNKLQFE